jgi:hypothetical protein
MGLVIVTQVVGGIEDGFPLLQERGRLLCPFILANMVLAQAGGLQKTMPHRARGGCLRPFFQRRVDNRITNQHLSPRQPLDKGIYILKVWDLPGRAIQPERAATGRFGQRRLRIPEAFGR